MDGFDTICLADVKEILEKFIAFNHPWVASAELNCWPRSDYAYRYKHTSDSSYRFLNSGTYIANIEYFLSMLNEWGVTGDFRASSDQLFLTERLLENQSAIALDTQCVLFQTLGGGSAQDFIFTEHRVINRATSRMPCIIHGNGHTEMVPYYRLGE